MPLGIIVEKVFNGEISGDDFLAYGPVILERMELSSDHELHADLHGQLAYQLLVRDDISWDTINHHLLEGLRYAELSGDSLLIAENYLNYGIRMKDQRRYQVGQDYAFLALGIYQRANNEEGRYRVYQALCDFCWEAGEYEQALEYIRKTIDYHRRNDEQGELAYAKLCELTTYYEMGDYPAAVRLADEILGKAAEVDLNAIANSEYILDVRNEAYLALKDTAAYINGLEQQMGIFKRMPEGLFRDYLIHDQQGEIYRMQHKPEGMVRSFAKAREKYVILKGNDQNFDHLGKLIEGYDALGQYRLASDLKDNLLANQKLYYQEQLAMVADEQRITFGTDEKRATIRQQTGIIDRQRTIQTLAFVIAGLLLLVLIGIYLGWKNNRQQMRLLAQRNQENELLLKEIHHRVKNNLEVVSSLLELQSAGLADSEAREAMQAGQSRVQSMGLLHQKLYQGENLAAIEMKDYFTQLAESLLESYETKDNIKVAVNMDPLELDVDTAVPLGLIVNELLTNTIKYAFGGTSAGSAGAANAGAVEVGLSKEDKGYLLRVKDNGVGKDFDAPAAGTGFGSRLINLLTRQLGGTLSEENDGGLKTEVRFEG